MNKLTIILIIIFFFLVGFLFIIATKTGTSSVLLPSDLLNLKQEQDRIRVIGKVSDKEIMYTLDPEIKLEFMLADPDTPKKVIRTVYHGVKPDLFAKGRDVIIDGKYKDNTLFAVRLLTQCPSKYEPPKVTK